MLERQRPFNKNFSFEQQELVLLSFALKAGNDLQKGCVAAKKRCIDTGADIPFKNFGSDDPEA